MTETSKELTPLKINRDAMAIMYIDLKSYLSRQNLKAQGHHITDEINILLEDTIDFSKKASRVSEANNTTTNSIGVFRRNLKLTEKDYEMLKQKKPKGVIRFENIEEHTYEFTKNYPETLKTYTDKYLKHLFELGLTHKEGEIVLNTLSHDMMVIASNLERDLIIGEKFDRVDVYSDDVEIIANEMVNSFYETISKYEKGGARLEDAVISLFYEEIKFSLRKRAKLKEEEIKQKYKKPTISEDINE